MGRIISDSVLFVNSVKISVISVLQRGLSSIFLKEPDKIGTLLIAQPIGDFIDDHVCLFEDVCASGGFFWRIDF